MKAVDYVVKAYEQTGIAIHEKIFVSQAEDTFRSGPVRYSR